MHARKADLSLLTPPLHKFPRGTTAAAFLGPLPPCHPSLFRLGLCSGSSVLNHCSTSGSVNIICAGCHTTRLFCLPSTWLPPTSLFKYYPSNASSAIQTPIRPTGSSKSPVHSRSHRQSQFHDFDQIPPLRRNHHYAKSLTCSPAEVGFLPFFLPTTYQGDLVSLLRVTTQARITECR